MGLAQGQESYFLLFLQEFKLFYEFAGFFGSSAKFVKSMSSVFRNC